MAQRRSRKIGGVVVALLVGVLAFAGIVQAAPSGAPLLSPVGTSFTYQGFITNNGNPANGNHNLRFKLYDSLSGVTQVGSTLTKNTVAVSDGYFTVELDFGDVFNGTALWLAIEVQGPGDPGYTALNPRQALTAAPFALYALNIPSHNHFGETWSGTATRGLEVDNEGPSGTRYGVSGRTHSPNGYGVLGDSLSVTGASPGVAGSSIFSPQGRGVYGVGNYGVYGETLNPDGYGLYGDATAQSGTSYGVYGVSHSSLGYGGYFVNSASNGTALYATGSGAGVDRASLSVLNTEAAGGVAAYISNSSTSATSHIYNGGSGVVLYLHNGGTDTAGTGGGDFIKAENQPEGDVQFRVSTNGSVYSDLGYRCGSSINDVPLLPAGVAIGQNEASIAPCLMDDAPADFAEMLPAVGSLGPGDVLSINPDGNLTQSSEPYQTTIVGVYSDRPSFLGNGQFADKDGYAPLAMLGLVLAKVSAENGAIQPGDLLVASSTPGHAMRAGENPPQGTVIGKALEPLTEGTGLIKILVTLQ